MPSKMHFCALLLAAVAVLGTAPGLKLHICQSGAAKITKHILPQLVDAARSAASSWASSYGALAAAAIAGAAVALLGASVARR